VKYLAFFIACLVCLGSGSPALAGEVLAGDIDDLLASRRVVGAVGFAARSAQLTPAGKAGLRKLAAGVETAESTDFLRVEGWAAAGKGSGVPLALERAKAVVQYLQENLQVKRPVYFTGLDAGKKKDAGDANRVDLVLYKNIPAGEEGTEDFFRPFFD
jgi:hypothetical protein